MKSLIPVFIYFVTVVVLIFAVFSIDQHLKHETIRDRYQEKDDSLEKRGAMEIDHALRRVTEKSNFVLVPLILVTAVLMVWCFYLRWMQTQVNRKRILWAEVQNADQNTVKTLSRKTAKENLVILK